MKKLIILLLLPACNPFDYLKYRMHRCNSIVDIYYYPSNVKYDFQETETCRYTLTILNKDLPTLRIKRQFYDKYKLQYEKYGAEYPYKRIKDKPIFKPKNYK
jgi:hypothetical protein